MFLFVSTYLLCPYPFIPPTSLYSSYIPVSLLISDSLLHSCTPLSPCILNIRLVSLYPSYIPVYLLLFCIQSFISVFLVSFLYPCIPLVSLLYPYIQSFIPVLLYLLVPPYPSCFPVSNPSSLYSSVYLYPPVSLCITTVSLYFSCFPVSNPSSLYSSVYLYPPVSLMYPCIQSFIPILICLLVPLVPLMYPCI